jgi:hypothetical protein
MPQWSVDGLGEKGQFTLLVNAVPGPATPGPSFWPPRIRPPFRANVPSPPILILCENCPDDTGRGNKPEHGRKEVRRGQKA